LNIGASNNPFLKKKQAYKESGIELTRELLSMSQFKFRNVEKRSLDLAEVAVKLWLEP
jgi:predicted translin family RNA/ssDNA-binding protein